MPAICDFPWNIDSDCLQTMYIFIYENELNSPAFASLWERTAAEVPKIPQKGARKKDTWPEMCTSGMAVLWNFRKNERKVQSWNGPFIIETAHIKAYQIVQIA